jgi:hypothetical protein
MWNPSDETATAVWRTRPAGRTAEWFRTVDKLGDGGTRKPPLLAMAKALTGHADVFELAVGPKGARPLIKILLRVLALAAR